MKELGGYDMAALETFFEAWGMGDDGPRSEAIDAAMAGAFVYSDPRSGERITDKAALIAYVGQFSANAPGWTATVVKTEEANGFARAIVAFGGKGPDGSEMVQHGTYFAETDGEGRITTLAGFVGLGTLE